MTALNQRIREFARTFHGPINDDLSYKGIETTIWPSSRWMKRLTPYSIDYIRYATGFDHGADAATVAKWKHVEETRND